MALYLTVEKVINWSKPRGAEDTHLKIKFDYCPSIFEKNNTTSAGVIY